jgi:hypothetical protein
VGELVWSLVVISAIVGEVVDSWVWNCGERLKEEWINGAQRGNRGCRPVSSKRGRRALGASAKGSAREGRGVATAGGRVRGVERAIVVRAREQDDWSQLCFLQRRVDRYAVSDRR